MKWIEYLPLAEKTLSTQFNCEEEFYQRILHAVIGALTEVEEILDNYDNGKLITDINKQGSIAEESADIFWYLSILYRELNISTLEKDIQVYFIIGPYKRFVGNKSDDPFNVLLEFTKYTLKFLDSLKKKIYYNKNIDIDDMILLSINMFKCLEHYCTQYNTNIEDILDKNIAKLKARYGDKFSSDRAINRNLDIEKDILES